MHHTKPTSESDESEASETESGSEPEYDHYQSSWDFLKIPSKDINKFVYYKDEDEAKPPIYFVIENRNLDLIKKLSEKKPLLNLESASHFTYTLAIEALRKEDYPLLFSYLKILTYFDKFAGYNKSSELMIELDEYLDNLTEKADLKEVTQDLLIHIKDISDQDILNKLNESNFINFLYTAYDGDEKRAQKIFNPDQLSILNEVGFERAKAKKNETGDKRARYFIKQALEETSGKQQILFYQDLYIDNLELAANEINKKFGTNLIVNRAGLCSAFTKMWLSNEAQEFDLKQTQFFVDHMKIARLSKEEIKDRIKDGEKLFIDLIKDHARNFDNIHKNYQFQGQYDQRTMKKNFGFEYIDQYDLNDINLKEPKYAYLRIRYTDGGGHAIGIHINEKEIQGKIKRQYKVWDSNESPRTFTTSAELQTYLNSFKKDPKINLLAIYEFSPFDLPATKQKARAIDTFLNSVSELNHSKFTNHQIGILNSISLLKFHYTNGVIVPLNNLVPLLAFLGNALNHAEECLDIGPLNKVITQQYLIKAKNVDLNKLSFIFDLVESALDQDPPQPQVVTTLFKLGLSRSTYYPKLSETQQDLVLMQAIKEGRITLVDKLLDLRKNDPKNFPVSLVLNEMIKNHNNGAYKAILAHLLLSGKTISEDNYHKLDRQPPPSSMFSKSYPPYMQYLKQAILERVLEEIKNHREEILDEDDKSFLTMLDYTMNPKRANRNGCFDILTSTFNTKENNVHEQIKQAFLDNNITMSPSIKSQYPFLYKYLEIEFHQPLSIHYASDPSS